MVAAVFMSVLLVCQSYRMHCGPVKVDIPPNLRTLPCDAEDASVAFWTSETRAQSHKHARARAHTRRTLDLLAYPVETQLQRAKVRPKRVKS